MDWAAVQPLKGEDHNALCLTLPVWGAAAWGPPARGCPSSTGTPRWKSPAALTQQPAPPWQREAKWIQDPQGLMESQAQAGFEQRFLSFPSASGAPRFFISSPFLGLPTCITLRGSLWCSQCDIKRDRFRQKAEEFPVSPLAPQWDPPQTIPPCSFWRAFMGNTAQRKPQFVFILSHMLVHKGKGWQKSLALSSGAAVHKFCYQIMQ